MSGPLSEEELTALLDDLCKAVDVAVKNRVIAAVAEWRASDDQTDVEDVIRNA